MKKVNLFKSILVAVVAVMSFSCSDDETGRVSNTITDIASRNADFSILVEALVKADLAATLDSEGSFTVFAPTNTAFTSFLNANGFSSLDDVPPALLKEVLLNHVVLGSLQAAQLTNGYVSTLATGSASSSATLSMYVDVRNGVKLNGVSNVTPGGANIIASNGVIHVVDAVIGLPTIVTFATADPNFSTLVTALTTLTPATDFVSVLNRTNGGNGDGINPPFTVFAPINDAFTDLNTELSGIGGIAALTEAQITSTLLYHVVGGANVRSNQIPAGPITTLETGTFTISGTTITDERTRTSGIIAVDVQATNGVIHAINKVILPNF
ncbi:fasciclin domain-containing protein [Flavobacterium sp.]|uniref:fasciclin domain-containing protein n=1 Tax=Flavobacterium sp. TaxID=239 RepID=UPI002FDA1A2B